MDDLLISNSHGRGSRLAQQGRAIKVFPGVYTTRLPTAWEAAELFCKKYPDMVLSGRTAVQLYTSKPLTLPLCVIGKSKLTDTAFITSTRRDLLRPMTLAGLTVQPPLLSAADLPFDEGVEFIETFYGTRDGKSRLEQDLDCIRRVPSTLREILDEAVPNTDSGAERKLFRNLRESGMKPLANYKIGPFYWDIVLKRPRVAIEIDGFDYHSSPETAARDAWKNNDASLRGWTTLRYTGSCLAHHFDEVLTQILSSQDPDFDAPVHGSFRRWHVFGRRFRSN